ncbi:MAG: alpha/beta fold hydrolase [Anaerolineales bacterium]
MIEKNIYQKAMEPWPDLLSSGNYIKLGAQNLQLFYYESGKNTNPTILMIHGLGDEADTWRHIIKPLSQNYHVIALDLPGFGRSTKPKRDYKPQFFMDTIVEFMSKLNIEKAVLMGSSLGAMLAHGIAIKNPEYVLGLILVGGSLLQTKRTQDRSLIIMSIPLVGEWLYNRLRKDPDAAYESLSNVYYRLNVLPQIDRDFLYTRVNKRVWSDDQRRAYFSTLRKLTPWIRKIQKSLPKLLTSVKLPTLLVRGEFDNLFLNENAQSVANIQPFTTLASLKKSGHLPHQERPQAFLVLIEKWLQGNLQK